MTELFLTPDHDPDVQRARAFDRQCAKVNAEMNRLFLMREWGNAEANTDLREARTTMRVMLGETTIADFVKRKDAA